MVVLIFLELYGEVGAEVNDEVLLVPPFEGVKKLTGEKLESSYVKSKVFGNFRLIIVHRFRRKFMKLSTSFPLK